MVGPEAIGDHTKEDNVGMKPWVQALACWGRHVHLRVAWNPACHRHCTLHGRACWGRRAHTMWHGTRRAWAAPPPRQPRTQPLSHPHPARNGANRGAKVTNTPPSSPRARLNRKTETRTGGKQISSHFHVIRGAAQRPVTSGRFPLPSGRGACADSYPPETHCCVGKRSNNRL